MADINLPLVGPEMGAKVAPGLRVDADMGNEPDENVVDAFRLLPNDLNRWAIGSNVKLVLRRSWLR